jgi:hypothetical protein
VSVAIGLGLMEFPFAGAADYWRWVDLCEAGGIDSLWQTDRLVSRQPILECMAVMAALAGRTRRLRFGMNVVSLALRDPVLLAKQCATIDVLSDGRLLPASASAVRGAGMAGADIDTKTAADGTDSRWRSSPGCGARTASTSKARLSPRCPRDLAQACTARADVDRRVAGNLIRHGALRHRLAGRRRAVGRCQQGRRGHQEGGGEAGRTIDQDHYGARSRSISPPR